MKHEAWSRDIVSQLKRLESVVSNEEAFCLLVGCLRDTLQLFEKRHEKKLINSNSSFCSEIRNQVCTQFRCLFVLLSLETISVLIHVVVIALLCLRVSDVRICNSFLHALGDILWHGRQYSFRRQHKLTVYKKDAAIRLVWLLHCLSALRGLVLLLFQLPGGERRRKHAKHKLQCLPPAVRVCLRCLTGEDHVDKQRACKTLIPFLCLQVLIGFKPPVAHQCALYCLLGRTATYIGRSKLNRQASLGAPLARGHEHVWELFNSTGASPDLKQKAFRHETVVDFAQFYLFTVSDEVAGFSEASLIRSSHANGNTIHRVKKGNVTKGPRQRPPHDIREPSNMSFVNKLALSDKTWDEAVAGRVLDQVALVRRCVNLSFRNAYRFCQSQCCVGPLCIYLSPILLLVFLSKPRSDFIPNELLQFVPLNVVFAAARFVTLVRSVLFQQVATNRINLLLSRFGEMKICTCLISVPWPLSCSDLKHMLLHHRHEIGRGSQARFRHVVSQLRFVAGKRQTYTDLFNMIPCAKSMNTVSLLEEDVTLRKRAWEGAEFKQLKKHHKTHRKIDLSHVFTDLCTQLGAWCRLAKCLPHVLHAFSTSLFEICLKTLHTVPCSTLSGFSKLNSGFVAPEADQVLVAEDKDPAAAWLLPELTYQRCMVHLLERESHRWETTRLTPEQAWFFKVACFHEVEKAGFGPLRPGVSQNSLPYMYCTVKAKCFRTGLRTCCDPTHSCFRKIVSYAGMEKAWRNLFRKVGRATSLLILKIAPGDETMSLSTAAKDLCQQFACLVHPVSPLARCQRHGCGKVKNPLELVVADAGAMYEAVDSALILESLSFFVQVARQLGYVGVAVVRSPKLRGFLVRHEHFQHRSVDVVTFECLQTIHALSLSQKYVCVGNAVFKQKTGVPIGGLLSKCQTSLLLCAEETIWKSQPLKRSNHGFPTALHWNQQVASCRYVDDCISMSHMFCQACLLSALNLKSHVTFELQNHDPLGATWLDLAVDVHGVRFHIDLAQHEVEWIQGFAACPKKFRMLPFQGEITPDAKARIRNAQARLIQVFLDPPGSNLVLAARALHYFMDIWHRSGYPEATVVKAWRRHLSNPTLSSLAAEWIPVCAN